jgi:hypothetical protein
MAAWICPKEQPYGPGFTRPITSHVDVITLADKSSWGNYHCSIELNADDTLAFSIKDASGATTTIKGNTKVKYDGSTWYYVVGSAKASDKARLYVNGVEDGSSKSMSTLFTPDPAGEAVFVSRTASRADGFPWFVGLVANISVYTQQLEP